MARRAGADTHAIAQEDHWLPGFNFNVKESDARGQIYAMLAICRTLELGRVLINASGPHVRFGDNQTSQSHVEFGRKLTDQQHQRSEIFAPQMSVEPHFAFRKSLL